MTEKRGCGKVWVEMKTGSEIIIERYRARNEKILELADKGWRHKSIAKMFKMKTSAVSMVIHRARKKELVK